MGHTVQYYLIGSALSSLVRGGRRRTEADKDFYRSAEGVQRSSKLANGEDAMRLMRLENREELSVQVEEKVRPLAGR